MTYFMLRALGFEDAPHPRDKGLRCLQRTLDIDYAAGTDEGPDVLPTALQAVEEIEAESGDSKWRISATYNRGDGHGTRYAELSDFV